MDILESLVARVSTLESNQTNLFDRMGKVEDKAKGAWNTINEVKKDMNEMKLDMKEMKLAQNKHGKTLKVLCVIMCILTVIVGGFFVYIWRHDAELAKSIITLGTTVGKFVPV